MKKIIITIDGHSACGKSTLARQLAQKLDYGYIDTGAMYRAVTYYFLENRVNVQKTREVDIALNKIDIHFKNTVAGNRTFLNGQDVEDAIRKMFVSKSVSHVAAMSVVRRKIVKQQQEMGNKKGIVMEGRDIGTVVFPKAELKIFLTANEDVRTNRRFEELKSKGQKVSAKAIKTNLKERDHLDSTRKDSPLKQAKEAIIIDNSNLTPKEQLAMILALANERIAAINQKPKAPIRKTNTQKSTKPVAKKTTSSSKHQQSKPRSRPSNNTNTKPNQQRPKSNNNTNTKNNLPKSKPNPRTHKVNQSNNKPADNKPNPKKSNSNKPRPQTKKTTPQKNKQKPQKPQKAAPKKETSPRAKSKPNNTPTKPAQKKPQPKRRPQPEVNKKPNPPKRRNTPKPKRNIKRKPDIEKELDDFSF